MEPTLSACSLLLRNDFTAFCNKQLQKEGLSQGLLYFILYTGRHCGCTPGELSAALKADAGYTTRAAEKLISGGFMEKRRSQSDRRYSHLYLTDRGKEIFKLAHTLFGEWDKAALGCLTSQERDTLLDLLSRVAEHVKQQSHE